MLLIKRISFILLFLFSGFTAKSSIDSVLLSTSLNTICYDSCGGNAKIEIFASSSTGPFRVVWSGNNLPGQSIVDTVLSSDTIFNLCAGDYSVVVQDISDGSSIIPQNFSITRRAQMSPILQFTEPDCHDSIDGSIVVSFVNNGTFPFKFQWSTGPNDTLSVLSGIGKGVYSLEITDTEGCVFFDSVKLDGPDSLEINISGIDVTCKNDCDGQALTNVRGGTFPYEYLWNNGDTNSSLNSLCPGNFIVRVTDFNGCTRLDSVIVVEPDSLLSNFNVTDANCNGNCDGLVVSSANGGIRPYNYHWSGYNDVDSTLNNVCSGLITATITDANGCFYTENIVVNEPSAIQIQSVVNASSCGVCDGDINVVASGGSGPYNYLWIGQKAQDTLPSIDSLCPGIYRLAISDNALCSDTFDIILSDDTSGIKDISFSITKASCIDVCDGSVLATAFGGIGPYSYLWNPGGQSDSVLTGQCAGSYSIEITDAAGCKRVEAVMISSESDISVTHSSDFIGCAGDNGGEISVQVSNGKAPYQFSWQGSSSTGSSASSLLAGSYPYKIVDANSCTYFDTALVSDPDTIGFLLSVSDEFCYNSCDGIASVGITNGKSPFSYLWSTGQNTSMISNLCSGDYWVDVIDANLCVKREYFTIGGATQIQSNASITNTGCGLSDGSIKLNPSGGTGPYSFCWFDQSINDSLGRLDVSTSFPYTVTITDSLGCSKIDSFHISSKGGPEFDVSSIDESCAGDCNGSISITHPNVTGPVSYIWLPSFSSSTSISQQGGLCSGTYYVGISTINCTSLKEVVIKKGKEIKVDFIKTAPTCNGLCDGSIVANVSGGVPPYSLTWSNGSSLDAISGLCAGNYSLSITDSKGCSISKQVSLEEAENIEVNLQTSNLTCYNVCDGVITPTISGGKAPFTYLWSNGSTGRNAENLCPGIYSVVVTDVNACTGTDTIAIGNGVPISASFSTVNADCGQCNGSLSVIATAGNGQPYKYLWSNGDTTNSISDLVAGIYTLDITDYQGCSQEFTTTVSNVGGPTLTDTAFDISCYSSCNGSAKAFASGATLPYFFQWNDALKQTGDSASGLCAGTYYYSATDSLGCISYDSVSIDEPSEIQIHTGITGISCPGNSDGIISLTISGGNGPYTYLWSNGDTTNFTDSLVQGSYNVIVTDTTGCIKEDTFDISDPSNLQIAFTVYDTKCFSSCDGRIEALVSGGTGPYTYLWNDPTSQTSNMASGLCAGYTVLTLTDANGCVLIDSALVLSPSNISATPTLSNPTCKDGNDGSISLLITGGISPYQVSWSNGMSGSNISGLVAGTYIVNIVDSNQCVFTDNYILNDPAGLTVSLNTTDPTCGSGNGSISTIVSGGSGSYSFLWNSIPSQSNSTASNLWAGIYTVIVTDNNTGCEAEEDIILNNSGSIPLTFDVVNEACLNNCDGEAIVHAGNGNFLYQWNNVSMSTDSIASNLCRGLYTVRVEDTSTNCVRFDTVRVGSGDFAVNLLGSNGVSCFGDCDGSAAIEGIRGTAPYDYLWNTIPPQSTQVATALCGGNYIATATDSLGCSESAHIVINEPDSLDLTLDILNQILCAGTCNARASVNIIGGTGPYSIEWNGNIGSSIESGLCAGSNTVEVFDANGCSKLVAFNITEAQIIVDNAIIALPACGSFNGSITLNPSGGTGPYFYQWSNGLNTNIASDLFAGIYSVVISDANGCEETFTYFLNNPNAPVLNFDKNTVKCNGDCNGVARVSPVGGVGPYSYIWDHVPVSTLDSLTDLCSGTYFVKVTDATGCIAFGADTITEPSILEGTINKITDGCGGFCEGEAIMIAQGGTMPYFYNWNSNPPQSSATATNLCSGVTQVILTDNNGCEVIDSVNITPPPALIIDSTTFLNASCFTNSDGEATVHFQGGTAPISFTWSDGQSTQTAINLKAGIISVILTDTNACSAFDTVNIGVTDTVLVTAFVDSFQCIGNQTLLRAEGYGASLFNWFEDSSGTLKSLGSGDSLLYTVQDSVIIYLRGQNSVTPPCFDLDTNFILGIPPPVITASASKNPIEEGESTELLASPFLFNGSYAWTPSESLNDTASISPIAFPEETTTYIVIGTDEYGCFGSDTITVVVIEDESLINGFSPNGDGVNDLWVIPSLEDFPNVIVEVYNRWGIQVFRSEGYREPWNGKFEGELLPNASYYFVIDYYGDGERVETGAVTILY